MLPNHNKRIQQHTGYCTLHSTFNHKTQHHCRTFSKSCKLIQMASTTKQMKYNYSLKIHKQMSLQYKNKTQSIPQNTKHSSLHIYKNSSHSQTRRRASNLHLKNISFSQLNTTNTFPIEL